MMLMIFTVVIVIAYAGCDSGLEYPIALAIKPPMLALDVADRELSLPGGLVTGVFPLDESWLSTDFVAGELPLDESWLPTDFVAGELSLDES